MYDVSAYRTKTKTKTETLCGASVDGRPSVLLTRKIPSSSVVSYYARFPYNI